MTIFIVISAIILWVLAGYLTYRYYWRRDTAAIERRASSYDLLDLYGEGEEDTDMDFMMCLASGICSVIAGLFWEIYWPARGILLIVARIRHQ